MNKLTDWMRSHQLAAFFILTFAITWGLGFTYDAALNRDAFWLFPLVSAATCGPALAGIIITAATNTQPRQGPRKAFWIAFFAALAVSALVWLGVITMTNLATFSATLVGLAVGSALPVAFVISMAYSRNPAMKRYMSSLVRLRGVWHWAVLALVMFPVLLLLPIPVSTLLGRQPAGGIEFTESGFSLVIMVAILFTYQMLYFNATGEEVGWRGFALPRLQARTSPLVAALVIALFWAPWHFFLWQAEGQPVFTPQFWLEKYIGLLLLSLFIVWICNRAGGSILVAGIAHAACNTAEAFIPVTDGLSLYIVLTATALVVIAADRMWKKLPPDHPAVYSEPVWTAEAHGKNQHVRLAGSSEVKGEISR